MSDPIQTITADKLCALTGLTDKRHREIARDGWFPKPVKGLYQLTATIQGLFKYYSDQNKPDNQSALANALGISRQLVSAHCRSENAPPITDVEAWKKYLATHGRTGSLPADIRRAIGEERLGILKVERANAEDKRARDKGELILWRDVDEFIRAFVVELFQSLDQTFTFELPPALKGLEEAQMSERCRAEIDRLKKNLRDRHGTFEQGQKNHD